MADYQPVNEADLEPAGASVASAATPVAPTQQGYEAVNDNDLAPAGPAQPMLSRAGVPAAVVQRIMGGDPFNRIFKAATTNFQQGFSNSYEALADKDKADLAKGGYVPGPVTGIGSALRYGADVFSGGLDALQDGFLSLIPGATQALGGAAEQAGREVGMGKEPGGAAEQLGRGVENVGEAAAADVADMHAASMANAARAQAEAPGVYSDAYRMEQTPGGGIVQTPLGKLPSEAEAAEQAKTAATALHLPDSAADLIHKTYLDTGRPPAEVLMDAKTNNGGVLSDLVSGKVPTAYQGPPRSMTPEELEAANVGRETTSGPEAPASGAAIASQQEGATPAPIASQKPAAEIPPAEPGVSKIGLSIEAKAVEANLTEGFAKTAGYDPITIKDQAERSANLVNNDFDQARAVIRGEQPLPQGLKGVALVTAMEDYIKKNPSVDLAYELANSPLVSATSGAAQELRLAAERTPDSATAALQQIRDSQAKQIAAPEQVAARRAAVRQAVAEPNGPLLPKEELAWSKFLDSIAC